MSLFGPTQTTCDRVNSPLLEIADTCCLERIVPNRRDQGPGLNENPARTERCARCGDGDCNQILGQRLLLSGSRGGIGSGSSNCLSISRLDGLSSPCSTIQRAFSINSASYSNGLRMTSDPPANPMDVVIRCSDCFVICRQFLRIRAKVRGGRRSRANPNDDQGHGQTNAHRAAEHDHDISKQTLS